MKSIDLKIVVLGPAGVGKTCVINRYCNNTFLDKTLATIGAGFFPQTVIVDDTEVNMMVWDTAGEERFRSVAPSLLRGANGLVLVFDITSPESLNELDIYLNMFLDTAEYDQNEALPIMLLGNKGDLVSTITEDTINDWKSRNNVSRYNVVSAKTGAGINEAFTEFVKTFIVKPAEVEKRSNPILIMPNQPSEKKGCC